MRVPETASHVENSSLCGEARWSRTDSLGLVGVRMKRVRMNPCRRKFKKSAEAIRLEGGYGEFAGFVVAGGGGIRPHGELSGDLEDQKAARGVT